MGSTTVKLRGDSLEIEGGKITKFSVRGGKITPKQAAELFFANIERLFDPKYDAMPAIKKVMELEKLC